MTAIEETARETIGTVSEVQRAFLDYKQRISAAHKLYSQDLINNLFMHPYTKIELIERDLNVSRLTATRYSDTLADADFLRKRRVGRSSYYTNIALYAILTKRETVLNRC